MVTADGTDAFVLGKRSRKRRDTRQWQRMQNRRMSHDLVRSGKIPKTPYLLCGSQAGLTIRHIEPMRPDRFVFLCQPCHVRAHRPLYRQVSVPLAYGQFSIRREAPIPRTEVRRG